MDTFALLLQGLTVAIQPINLLYALIGVTLGTAVGVLPGIGPALTVALLLPVTYRLDPAGSHDVKHLAPAGEQVVRDDAAMAAPPDRLCAHDRTDMGAAERKQLHQPRPKFGGARIIGIVSKTGVLPE